MNFIRSVWWPTTFVVIAVGLICLMVSVSKNHRYCSSQRDVADEKAIFLRCMDLGSSPVDSLESIRLCRSLANMNAKIIVQCTEPQNNN